MDQSQTSHDTSLPTADEMQDSPAESQGAADAMLGSPAVEPAEPKLGAQGAGKPDVEAAEKGYFGSVPDQPDNEAYTVKGVASGEAAEADRNANKRPTK